MEDSGSSNGLCRLCASLFFLKSGFFIFGDDHIRNKIELYLQIQMIQDDYLPKNICTNCLSKIENFHEFAENARKIQHSLHVYSDTNVYETQTEHNLVNGIETLGKVDSNNLFAKEEQQFNLHPENFVSAFNKESCDTQDSFLNLFPSSSMSSQDFNKVVSSENSNKNLSELKEPNARSGNADSYTSIIKPIDMKHLTTPSTQPNLFNLPSAPSNLFNTSSPIILDCSYSDDVMGSGYLDISSYPDMSEIEDITINYKTSIKFEMGKQCGDSSSFDISDVSFVNSSLGPPSTKPALTDPNDYFNNFEYKHKDAIKYPDFDLMRELHLNMNGDQTPSRVNEQLQDQSIPINIDLTIGNQEMSKCSLPMSSESKQLFLPPLQTTATSFTSIFDSWSNQNMTPQFSQINSTMSEQFNENDAMEMCMPGNTPTGETVTYDVIYLGEDIYASSNTEGMKQGSASNSDTSVLRNRLLNMKKKSDSEAQQVITLSEDTNVNTASMQEFDGIKTAAEVNSTFSHSNKMVQDSTPPKSMSSHLNPSEMSNKTPTIQCKSLDKMLKETQLAQPSIQCKSLDKIIKEMKIENRLSKLQKQKALSSDAGNRNRIPSQKLAIVPSNRLIKQSENSSENSLGYCTNDQKKESNATTKQLPETHVKNIDETQASIDSTQKSNPISMSSEVLEEAIEVNVVRTGVNSCSVQNVNVSNDMVGGNSKPSHGNNSQDSELKIDPKMSEANVDKDTYIKERIIDLKKSKNKLKKGNNFVKTSDEISPESVDNQNERNNNDDDWKHIKCDKCSQIYPSKTKFDFHYKSVHKAEVVYTCLCCSKSTNFYATFKSHCYRRNNQNRYRCDYANCRKNFNSKTCVETHIKSVHLKQGTPKYVCEMCGSVFPTKNLLHTHLPCKQTDSIVSVCQTCSKIFSTAYALKDHVRRVHSANTYVCDICAKSFHIKFNLAQHIKTHTSNRPFSCPHCGKSYFERSHLRRHLQKHITTRDFPCPQCDKSFRSEELRKVHEKTHALCRPLQCEFCPKSFLTITKLKEHNNIHTGERPFTCKFCELSFSNYPNWYKHMKRKHPNFMYTGRKIALSGGSQQSNRDEISTQPTEGIAPDSSLLLDISSNTFDKMHLQATTSISKMDSFDIILDSGNSNSSNSNIYASSVSMFQTTEYSFHQF